MNRLDPKLHGSLLSSVYTLCTRATLSFTATLLEGAAIDDTNLMPSKDFS
jgi:hypothetical protein